MDKVQWCLDKAQKELTEQGKHRGLVKTEPDIEEAKKHLAKAEHNFKAILAMQKVGFPDWSVSAGFYCIYHCFLAVISKYGYESRNQECTIALIKQLKSQGKTELDEEIITSFNPEQAEEKHDSTVIDLRENYQYGTATTIENEKLKTLKKLCKKVIEQTKNELYPENE